MQAANGAAATAKSPETGQGKVSIRHQDDLAVDRSVILCEPARERRNGFVRETNEHDVRPCQRLVGAARDLPRPPGLGL